MWTLLYFLHILCLSWVILKALNHFHHRSASFCLKCLSGYILIHHHSLCNPHVSGTLFTLGFNLLLVADSSVPLLPQEAHPCSPCLYSSQWESIRAGVLALNLGVWTLAQSFIPDLPFLLVLYYSFFYSSVYTAREAKMGSLPKSAQRASWDNCDESSRVLSLHLPSNIQFPPATDASVFCFIVFCLNTLQSANSLVPTSQWMHHFMTSNTGILHECIDT